MSSGGFDPRRPRFELGMRPEQRMQLQPRMLTAIEALELPIGDLEQWLRDAYQSNEALQLEEAKGPPAERLHAARDRTQRHAEWLEGAALGREPDWVAQLEGQLPWLELEPSAEAWVRFLIEHLDERGLLTASDEELLAAARELGLEGEEAALGRAIADLQRLEPRGLGGRDATEAMLLQLDPGEQDYGDLCHLLEAHLDDLLSNRLPRIARGLGIPMEEVARLVARASKLDPSPARSMRVDSAPVLRADLAVQATEDGYRLSLAHGSLPSVSLDTGVTALVDEDALPREVRRHLRRRIEAARWVVDAVRAREETLLRVAHAVFSHQADFLSDGPGALRPLSMQEVGEQLGLHPSTVSRAVSGKHVQTDFGVLPLRSFFPHTACERQEASADRLLEQVKGLVAGEDKHAPLSDDAIAAELAERGFSTKRRTVAKYRKQLGIPSSYLRRRYVDDSDS